MRKRQGHQGHSRIRCTNCGQAARLPEDNLPAIAGEGELIPYRCPDCRAAYVALEHHRTERGNGAQGYSKVRCTNCGQATCLPEDELPALAEEGDLIPLRCPRCKATCAALEYHRPEEDAA